MSHMIPPIAARGARPGAAELPAGTMPPAAFSCAAEALRAKIRHCAARNFAARQNPPDETIFE